MAIIHGSLQRALLKYPDLNLSKIRLIGWGAGQFFQDFYPFIRAQLPLEYTVCPRPENHGKIIHGIEVKPIEALQAEPTETTLIVVMTNHISLILNQIREIYPQLRTVKAISFDQDGALSDEILEFSQLQETLSLQRTLPSTPKTGIFVQGKIDLCTPLALAWNRTRFPSTYQCMVTWDHQDRNLINQCHPWLDKLILVPQPENLGPHYCNAVWRSARMGSEHLAEQGIKFSVRCRSDNLLTGSINEAIHNNFSYGMNKGRIAISLAGGLRHVPFHFTEKTMLASAEDMVNLWSIEEDIRPKNHPDSNYTNEDHFLKLRGFYPESHLWINYAKKLGYRTETLVQSYEFARDQLLALEPYLSWYSIKQSTLFNMVRSDPLFHTSNWNRLFTHYDETILQAKAVGDSNMTILDLLQNRVG